MQERVTRLAVGLLFGGLTHGCVPAKLTAQVDAQKLLIEQQQHAIDELKNQIPLLVAQIENVERTWWSERLCKSGKIAEFISEVQAGIPEVCTSGSLETALIFLNNEPYSTFSFHPDDRLVSLNLVRNGQIRELLKDKYIHASTRFLVMFQPSEETKAARDQALNLGDKFINMMRNQIAPEQKLKILGPHLLPCRLRNEVRNRFRGPMDRPVAGEPKEGQPQIRAWVFRSDC